jgi:hypothetical protein
MLVSAGINLLFLPTFSGSTALQRIQMNIRRIIYLPFPQGPISVPLPLQGVPAYPADISVTWSAGVKVWPAEKEPAAFVVVWNE